MSTSTSTSTSTTPSLIDTLFQRTLTDLIKGLRLHPPGPSQSTFISKTLTESRHELTSTDLQTKHTALQKLTYLHSLHHIDISSFASFPSIELSSSSYFPHKQTAYLTASLSFHPNTPLILLLTNQLRKDLVSTNVFHVSLALSSLSVICTPDLARDLTPDIFNLLASPKLFLRKKAVACLLKLFSQFPDAVRVCFKRLVDNLEPASNSNSNGNGNSNRIDDNYGDNGTLIAATVGVFCELCGKDARAYVPLAPEFYRILVESRNNWVLIKVLKIFARLGRVEPRIGKKVVGAICEVMKRSEAKSLVYECVRTIVGSFYEDEVAVREAVGKVREFLVDGDLNLRYLGLQGLLVVARNHLWAVVENKEVVIKSLSDADRNIKGEALKLVMVMVCEENVVEICRVLVGYALKSDPEFCNEILRSMLVTCSRNVYEVVNDFDWYVSLLGEMARMPHCENGEEIEYQLIDIGMRVKDVRPELVRVGRDLLIDPALLGNPFIHRILSAAAWVTGEYVKFSRNPFEIMEALLQPRTNLLPPSIRSVYIHSAFKVLSFCIHCFLLCEKGMSSSPTNLVDIEPGFTYSESEQEFTETDQATSSLRMHKRDSFTHESIANMLTLVITSLTPLAESHDVEIHERVRNVLGLARLAQQELCCHHDQKQKMVDRVDLKTSIIIKLINDALLEDFGPVSFNAQERVPVPDGLVLEEDLSKLDSICADVQFPITESFSLVKPVFMTADDDSLSNQQNEEESETSAAESTSLLSEHRKRHGLFYLPSDENKSASSSFPPANDPNQRDKDVEDLVKLTEDSLVLKRKPNQSKPRPVVVRLDEGDGLPMTVKKPDENDELISGAVRDVLLGNETSSHSNNPSGGRKGKSRPKDKVENTETGSSIKRTSKHRNHGKTIEEKEESSEKGKKKSGGKHKSRRRADGGIDVAVQKPVIPDFLL